MKIKEIIVVEGRDDTDAVKKSVDAVTIETHGYGITKETWKRIEIAYKSKGIIVFTDPDHAGEQIRRRITDRFPDAKQAFLDKTSAAKAGDIGIENASPGDIRTALKKTKCEVEEKESPIFTEEDMIMAGLTGQADSAEKRRLAGQALGIGYANSKTMLKRLNKFGITKEDFLSVLKEI